MTSSFFVFMGGAASMFFALQISTNSLDPEWLYWLLAGTTAALTGAVELWRQRGVEGEIENLKSRIQALEVDVAVHDRLIRESDGDDDE